MADHENGRVNMRSELGISRRDLLRRGAIAGGTLLWAAPVIQSLRTPAFAQEGTPFTCSCCQCADGTAPFNGSNCAANGLSFSACQTACGGNVAAFCTGDDTCACSGTPQNARRCSCT